MLILGLLWLFLLHSGTCPSPTPNNSTASGLFEYPYGSEFCEPDGSLFVDSKWFFAVDPSCYLVIKSQDPVTVQELRAASRKPRHTMANCKLWRASVFPVSADELGTITRDLMSPPMSRFSVLKLRDWEEPRYWEIAHMRRLKLQLNRWRDNCHMNWRMRTLRCMSLTTVNGKQVINYTDFEGAGPFIRVFQEKDWPLPPAVNVKNMEMLAYYDEFTQTDHVWMEHNLQWLYNVDMDEKELRGNRSLRLTTYHLSTNEVDLPLVVPVYADAGGLVTAHCYQNKTFCRYMFSRVDAKSALESTCLLELDYLTTVGVVTPLRTISLDETGTPRPLAAPSKMEQQEGNSEGHKRPGFMPLYVLIFLVFLLVLSSLTVHLMPPGTDDLVVLFDKLDVGVSHWKREFEYFLRAMRRRRLRPNGDPKKLPTLPVAPPVMPSAPLQQPQQPVAAGHNPA